MTSVKDIVEILGRAEIQKRLALGTQSVTNCISENEFPARYYAVLKEMADEKGVDLPLSIFNWRRGEDAA